MRTLTQIREKHEENKRNCLLKKIKFYEYLISYGGPHNSFLPTQESKNKTTSLFFPQIDHNLDQLCQSPSKSAKMTSVVVEIDDFTQDKTIPTQKGPRMQKIRMRQCFRPGKIEGVLNISELTAKSMTPSIRINKPFSSRERKQHSTIKQRSFRSTERSPFTVPKMLDAKRVAFVNDASDTKQSKRPRKLQIPQKRKGSICPWDVDQSPLL